MKELIWKFILRLKNPSCSIKTGMVVRSVKMEKKVTLEKGAVVGANFIGKYTFINKYCLIDKNVKSIGRFCSIAYNARVGLGAHPQDWISTHPFAYQSKYGFVSENKDWNKGGEDTIIGNDVWIGANATILAGVKIGNGAIVGANSLVTKDVEPYSIVIGTPAKHYKYRFVQEEIERLEQLKWWDWEDEKIKRNIDLFDSSSSIEKLLSI